jgi:hypothetical protein
LIKGKKVKLTLCLTKHHAMKTYWGSGGIAPRILDLGTRWRQMVSFTPRPLYPQGKSPSYPLDRRLGGPQGRSGRGGEEKNSQPPPGIEPQNPDHPIRSPMLYRLSYHCSLSLIKLDEKCNSDSLYSTAGRHVVTNTFSISKKTAAVYILLLKFRVTWSSCIEVSCCDVNESQTGTHSVCYFLQRAFELFSGSFSQIVEGIVGPYLVLVRLSLFFLPRRWKM